VAPGSAANHAELEAIEAEIARIRAVREVSMCRRVRATTRRRRRRIERGRVVAGGVWVG